MSLDVQGEVGAVAVSRENRDLERVFSKALIHLPGSTSLGDPCKLQPRILEYPSPVQLSVDVETGFVGSFNRAFDKLIGDPAAYLLSLVSGPIKGIPYRSIAQADTEPCRSSTS